MGQEKFKFINDIILESKSILELKDDWDDEGALKPSAKVYNLATIVFQKIVWGYFNSKCMVSVNEEQAFMMLKININACNDGSIDIHFNNEKMHIGYKVNKKQVLINVSLREITFAAKKSNPKAKNDFSNDDFCIEGKLNKNSQLGFILNYLLDGMV